METLKKFAILANHKSAQWEKVQLILTQIATSGVPSTKSLVESITSLMELSGHIKYARSERLRALSRHIESFPVDRKVSFFSKTIPFIANCALQLPKHFPEGQILTCTSSNPTLNLQRESIPAILANMFFCCIPVQPHLDLAEYIFHGFMCDDAMFHQGGASGKLDCILAYFDSVPSQKSGGAIKIHRNCLALPELETLAWIGCTAPMKNCVLYPKGKIEDEPTALMVDFANAYIGGGIDPTCVQEQILFAIHPELFVCCLLCEKMKDNEAIFVEGFQRVANYEGYDESFKFTGPFAETEKEPLPYRKMTAIDALFLDTADKKLGQFDESATLRELNKAYAGFLDPNEKETRAVATGKWGSGAFNGNVQYKLLIQWIAASRAGRDVHFYSFGDSLAAKGFEYILEKIRGKKTVGEMTKLLLQVGKTVLGTGAAPASEMDPGTPLKVLSKLLL